MHFDNPPTNAAHHDSGPWYRGLTRYHWFVLFVAALGWLFDTMDQQLFVLARRSAMEELVVPAYQETAAEVAGRRLEWANIATSVFIAGWAMGGLFFGMLGDRIGRAKTMLITILLYSLFTGLSALSTGPYDFAFYRFLTGLGVGGEFAVGVALVAEVMPTRARTGALGLLQALSAFGNITAALINLGLGIAQEEGMEYSPWRIMFVVGALPALVAILIRWGLKEPEAWRRASSDEITRKQLGSYKELFGDPRWRKHALLGLVLGCSGIIGLWSVGFFTPDLIGHVQKKGMSLQIYDEKIAEARAVNDERLAEQWRAIRDALTAGTKGQKLDPDLQELQTTADPAISGRLARWSSYTSLMINFGAFFGIFGFSILAQRLGRKPTFRIALTAAFVSTVVVFWFLEDMWHVLVLVPIMGFCQLSLFGGYAIYFPELFPTRLRSTGTSFCYNVGRFVAALGPLAKSALEQFFNSLSDDRILSLRYAGVTMCLVFLLGFFVLPFLPETRGQPLPE